MKHPPGNCHKAKIISAWEYVCVSTLIVLGMCVPQVLCVWVCGHTHVYVLPKCMCVIASVVLGCAGSLASAGIDGSLTPTCQTLAL